MEGRALSRLGGDPASPTSTARVAVDACRAEARRRRALEIFVCCPGFGRSRELFVCCRSPVRPRTFSRSGFSSPIEIRNSKMIPIHRYPPHPFLHTPMKTPNQFLSVARSVGCPIDQARNFARAASLLSDSPPRPMILVAVHIGVSLFVVGLVMRKSFLACPGCLATAWPLEEVYRWYRFRLLLRPNSLLTNTGDGEAGWGCASIDETTTGMPEKLLDAARATCVSECISTDAQFLLASRGSARSLVGRCWSNAGAGQVSKPGQTDPASNKRSDFGQFQSDSCVSRVSKPARASDFHSPRSPRVSFPTHPRHLNFTVEGLNFSGDAIKSRTGDDDSDRSPFAPRQDTKPN